MYERFADCIEALMQDGGLDEAEGGLIVKMERGFEYCLHGEPEPEAEPFGL